jgi:antitoxin ParD1/3/4
MSTMNISLPDSMKRFVDQQVREGDYAGASDYVRDLVRREQRAAAEAKLRRLIAEGLASGPSAPVDPSFFEDLRKRARARARKAG